MIEVYSTTGTMTYDFKDQSCKNCNEKVKEYYNLCHFGRYSSLILCSRCYENKELCKILVDEANQKLTEKAKQMMENLKNAIVMVSTQNCDEESLLRIRNKIFKLNLDFPHKINNNNQVSNYNSGDVTITFQVKDYNDFKVKFRRLCEAKSNCGCSLVYGEGHTPDVYGYTINKKGFSIDLYLLSNVGV